MTLALESCVNYPENDTGLAGGAIDVNTLVTSWTDPNGTKLQAVSTSAGDTAQIDMVVRRRTTTGAIGNMDTKDLNGVTPVILTPDAVPYTERFLSVAIATPSFGVLTISNPDSPFTTYLSWDGQLWTKVRRLFIDAFASTAIVTRYDKTFWHHLNDVGTSAVSPIFRLTADPSAKIKQGVHTSLNDSATIANRLTAPAGVTFVDDNVDQAGPADITPGDKQGVWWEMTAAANNPALNSTFTSQVTFQTV